MIKLFNYKTTNTHRIITILGVRIKIRRKTDEKEFLLTLGQNSVLHKEAEIINATEDKDKITVGDNTHIRGKLFVYPSGGKISVGDYCYIGENTNIWSACSINIGNNVLIAHNVNIFDHNTHPINHIERAEHYKNIITTGHPKTAPNWNEKSVLIKDYAWIGCGAIILKGVTIGRGAIVAAGSVVTHDVEDFTLVAGNPAKVVKILKSD